MGIRNGETAIPLVIMEEHKEAYYFWHWFLEKGFISEKGNILLHVDHHPDDIAGLFAFDPDILPQPLSYSRYLSYELLGIANFIVPAVYEGLFTTWAAVLDYGDKVEYCKGYVGHRKVTAMDSSVHHVLDMGEAGLKERAHFAESKAGHLESNLREYDRYIGGLGYYTDWSCAKVVLDIDLDYFCWDDRLTSAAPERVEITFDAWKELLDNTYNPFRIMPVVRTELEARDGKYYLKFAKDMEFMAAKTKTDKTEVEKRLDAFFAWLKSQKMKPAVIDICRSRLSSYLDTDHFPWIEEEVLKRLGELYSFKIFAKPQNF